MHGKCMMKRLELTAAHAGGLHTFTICACAPKLVHVFNICMMQMVACIWYMVTMQRAADSMQALFPCNYWL